ncbi:selenoprotein M-like [Symsagittifera roscoffensis]|uniref:selenoprotein M-like n=1 Tax=Symsagittifera roscoffensis TaxID=84072 RepID=UPI00307CC0DB
MAWMSSVLVLLAAVSNFAVEDDPNAVFSARIESCSGCKLNRLPDVKRFLNQKAPLIHNVEVKWIGGANPDAFFLNKDGEIVETVDLTKFKSDGLIQLFVDRGFHFKLDPDEQVPRSKQRGPYYIYNEGATRQGVGNDNNVNEGTDKRKVNAEKVDL